MAKFKVLKAYRDKELDRDLEVNDEVEMTVKRSEEVKKHFPIKVLTVIF